jgi:hypothetical protein
LSILARILRDRGVVTEKQLQQAIQHQVLYGGRLGTSLHELGLITEERLQEVLSRVHGIRNPIPVDLRQIGPDNAKLLPRELARKHRVFPYKLTGKTLFLLMVDPQDHTAKAQVGFQQGYIVKPLIIPEFRMIQLLHDHYGVEETWRYEDRQRPKPRAVQPLDPREALELLDEADSRDAIVEALLSLCLATFRRVVFFIVREPWVVGWHGGGEGIDRASAARLRIPLDEPSVFQTVTRDRTVFVGRFPSTPQNLEFLEAIDKRPSTNAAVFPVLVRNRVVNLVYADQGPGGNLKADLGELLVAVQKVSRAYLRVIRQRVKETRETSGAIAPRS